MSGLSRTRRFRAVWAAALMGAGTVAVAPSPAHAAVINVGCSPTDLVAAVNAANATPAADTITLTAGCTYTFTAPDNHWYGPNALPAIASTITIEGNGATIERDASAPKFRLFYVGADPFWAATPSYTTPGLGNLTLHNLTVRNGLARGGGARNGGAGAGMGGAIFSQGRTALVAVTMTANVAQGGSTSAGFSRGGGGIGTDAAGEGSGGGFGPGTFGGAAGGSGAARGTGGGGGGGGFRTSDTGASASGASGGDGGGPATGTGGSGGNDTGPGGVGGHGSGGGGGGGHLSAGGSGGGGGGFGAGGGGGGGTGGGGGGGVGGGGGAGGTFSGSGGGGFGGGGGRGGSGGFGGGGGAFSAGGFGGGTGGPGSGTGGDGGGGAGLGGAVFNHQGVLTVLNSTLATNTASGGTSATGSPGAGLGGAIFNLNGTVSADFTTIAHNTAAQGGGGIYNLVYDSFWVRIASVTLARSIVSDSAGGVTNVVNDKPATTSAGANQGVATVSAAGSLVESPTTGTIGGPPLTADPNLAGSLAANGAPNRPQTLALQGGSTAIGAAGATCAPNSDQRAFLRPAGVGCDLGAFELEAATTPALAPGDLVVVDHSAGTGSRGGLFSVNPTTGARTLRSNFGEAAQGPVGAEPAAVAVTSAGTLFVVDYGAGTSAAGALFRVDPRTGDRVLLTDFGDGTGPAGVDPHDLALGLGVIYVVDPNAGTNANGALFRVDPTTGARSVLAEFNGSGTDPAGVAVAPTGEILVTDRGGAGKLFSVNADTGAKTLLSDFADSTKGPLGVDPSGVAVTPAGTVVVADRGASAGRGQVLWVDPATGVRTLLDDMGTATPLGGDPIGIALAADGKVLTAHRQAGTSSQGQIVRLDPATGTRIQVSDFGSAGQGPTGVDPLGVAVVPQPLHPGDIWVADQDAGTGGRGALFRVDRTTGERILVSDFGTGANLGSNPFRVAISSAGTVLVIDYSAGGDALGQLFSVNPATGTRTVLSDFNTGPSVDTNPLGVAVGPGGSIFVVDPFVNGTGQLFRVDPQTGTRSVLSDFGSGDNLGDDPAGVAVAPGGRVLVVDDTANGGSGALFSVDAITGQRSIVTTFASTPAGADPVGVSVTADGTKALVADSNAGAYGGLFSVDLTTGARTLVSDFGSASQGPLGADPFDVAATPAGAALVIDSDSGTGFGGALFAVNTRTGNRSVLSDFGSSVQGPTASGPRGVAVVPVQQPNLLVVDPQAGGTQAGMVFRVDPVTGMRSVLADYARAQQGALGIDPYSAALTASGRLWMTDISAGTNRLGGLFAADSLIGTRSLASDLGAGANTTQNPTAVVRLPSGLLAVVDPTRGAGGKGAVYTVDPTTGARVMLSDFGNATQGNGNLMGQEPMGATLDANGRLVVIDVRAGTGTKGALFRVDTTTGNRTLVHDFGAGGAPLGIGVRGVALGPAGQLLVADHGGQGVPGTLWSIDPVTGARSVAAATLGSDPFGVIVRADGTVYVIDDSAGTNGQGGVWRVTLADGSRTLVSDFGNPAQGPTGDAPIGGAAAASSAQTAEPTKDKPDKDKVTTSCQLQVTDDGCQPKK